MWWINSSLLCCVCLCSLVKLVLPELHCCNKNNSLVYKLRGEVSPDCSITWLMQDSTMVVDNSGNVDPNTVVSYQHSELTMKSRDSGVWVREDCLSGGERVINCTAGLCESEKGDLLTNDGMSGMSSPLIVSLISLVLLFLLS
ncbi:hypothetical protein Q7C36_007147 [Tachysurus vachellii]|uniref:Uncharacterized protein n=1 Tax=Tachysurus vachellii TaxID=175792 RepID=A0AA88NAV0_TACVA|nr:hypothetical protein Q7C36_007147 [Tachysurus vachellii]